MSAEAQACVSRIRLPAGTSSAKFVLWVLANHANGDPEVLEVIEAWPSIQMLVESTGQDRKTVIGNLKRLQEWGLIEDAGRRVGRTGQVVVYRLNIGSDLFTEQCRFRNHPDIGTVPKLGRFQWGKQSQFSAETVPIFRGNSPNIGTRNRNGTIKEGSLPPADAREDDAPDFVPDRVGTFEGQDHSGLLTGRPTAAGVLAVWLRAAGYSTTSLDPNLLAAAADGVTTEQVEELASLHPPDPAYGCSPNYLLTIARRQLAEAAATTTTTPVPRGTAHATDRQGHRGSASERVAQRIREAEQRDAAAAAAAHALAADG